MSLYSDVRAGCRLVAISALSEYPTMPVIFSHLNGAEPAESYVVVNILSIEQRGHAQTSTLTNTLEELSIAASYEILVQYSFCGSLSGEASQSFTQRINNNPWVFEQQGKSKLGFMRKSQVRRAPQLRDTQWVDYHNMDVTYMYTANTQQAVDVIESVILEDESSGDIFTVPPGIDINPPSP